MRVIEIVTAHLEANGFDGLCHGETECGCYIAKDGTLGDFHICGENFSDCEPAYRFELPPGDPRGGWWMSTRKDWTPKTSNV